VLELTLLLLIIGIALVLFIGGWLALDLVGLLVLAALALIGLVSPAEALAGFSSTAVVTVWAMFIIPGGSHLERNPAWLGALPDSGGLEKKRGDATCSRPSERLQEGNLLVVLMTPVALKTAADLSISPHLIMMTIAMAVSASFANPLSHPAHLLVMGPAGYRFIDYAKLGLPLNCIALAICVWLLPIWWPA
jgi:di/tricarboxylate transporter